MLCRKCTISEMVMPGTVDPAGNPLEKGVHHIGHLVIIVNHGDHPPLVQRRARVRDAQAHQVTRREVGARPQPQVGVLVVELGQPAPGQPDPGQPAPGQPDPARAPDGAQRHRQALVEAGVAAARARQRPPPPRSTPVTPPVPPGPPVPPVPPVGPPVPPAVSSRATTSKNALPPAVTMNFSPPSVLARSVSARVRGLRQNEVTRSSVLAWLPCSPFRAPMLPSYPATPASLRVPVAAAARATASAPESVRQ